MTDFNAYVDLMEPNNEILKYPLSNGDENEVDYLNLDPDDWEKNDFTPDIKKVLEENGYRLTSECETDGDILSFTCVKDA